MHALLCKTPIFVLHDNIESKMVTSDPSWPPDENHGSNVLIACGICVCFALALVLIRVYVRLRYTKNFGFDDWCIVVAMVGRLTSTIENEDHRYN